MDNKRTFILIVQGEGRGHMTQCIALHDALITHGHIIKKVIIGKNAQRAIPPFVYDKISCPIVSLVSPTFVIDKKGKGVQLKKSILKNVLNISSVRQSIKTLRAILKKESPNVVINFYDPLISLLYFFKKPPFCIVSVAHQNIFLHPKYNFPPQRLFDKIGLKLFTKLNARRANVRIALSLYPLDHCFENNIYVSPPLLRKEVFEQVIIQHNYILIYLVNAGYLTEVTLWSKQNPNTKIHCFCERDTVLESEKLTPSLTWHKLSDTHFLQKMAHCTGLASAAGFESVAECMYFGKPALLVPIAGHYEQYCNARDANFAKAAIYHDSFRIEKLLSFAQNEFQSNEEIKQWMSTASEQIINTIEKKAAEFYHD